MKHPIDLDRIEAATQFFIMHKGAAMTHSAIKSKREKIYFFIGDRNLLQFLIAMGSHLDALPDHNLRWLGQTVMAWMEEFQSMPPGARDMELDPWLTTPARLALFKSYLQHLAHAPAAGDYDEAAAQEVARRLLASLDEEKAKVKVDSRTDDAAMIAQEDASEAARHG